ncbi:hypothetical protein N7499_000864 [Penicillium canescens]|uniref:Zn(2)-C6 fungal-type domain-containing protein n=1 Tax=Penicillium canescens TaxID=5083 RepID=A0AAD6II90_PENCN|nr:uncharacterized protein N7446_010932 [Penicillium canescens]KAJ6029717.1 hypothetical protein N7444_012704 [Penicillium canescens]KAJ6048149.1 hypothetical protein N7460_004296 [Penicillium canescens]KAJ6048249.1 hypothetical protein N7446_010932 [Penicillium canescens]KAJ6101234.1 hypothetical protein N7499_000864 [Penicillium canescens]KAJ6173692.1 hypothetical protein N7485_006504 [Penicillium canescens]
MARPKVLPANRLRANTACTACRSSKKRCSGSFPCTNCINKGRSRTCTPFKSLDTNLRNRPVPASRPQVSGRPPWSETEPEAQSSLRSQIHEVITPRRESDTLETGSRSPEATHRTHSRMLRNLQGERVYVGKAASLSFLQLLRDTVTQHIGPSQFSHNVRSEDMLETEAHHDLLNFSEERCSVEEKRQFIQNYEAATTGFLYLGCGEGILSSLIDSAEPKTDKEKTRAAIVDLMVAIGAQTCLNEPETVQMERFYFARGQRRTFANFLEDPSMDLIRVFLLLSFYMLGACRRNAAFMYLGVASRAAVALGFHVDPSGSLSRNEHYERSRLWMSLCVLDLMVSSILGRPSAISPLLPESRQTISRVGTDSTATGLVASYHLSFILDEIINRLYSEKAASTETADLLLGKLNRWSEHLPHSLRTTSSEHENESAIRQHTIGNMHVACSYHFAVILVTRPFLISALSVRLARLHQSLSSGVSSEPPGEDPAHSRLAAACIDSAVYMLQTCLEVLQSGLLFRNMCILKAFVFAAALVLGFSMFSHRDVDSEIDGAFGGALTILRMLAPQSAQAAHYLEITSMLESAITQQRQQLAAHARQRRSQYVNRIFSLNDNPTAPQTQPENADQPETANPRLAQGAPYSWLQSDDGTGAVTPLLDGTSLDWEGMDLPLWDSFPFLTELSII